MIQHYRSNGKLLITGEYVVLDGALSLALPSRFGQQLSLQDYNSGKIKWIALSNKGEIWFEVELDISKPHKITVVDSTNFNQEEDSKTKTLIKILEQARILNPEFLLPQQGFEITTTLEFPTNWGLGSSSTLISNIALWAQVNPYTLLWNAFSGSGYDIACAQNDKAITYQLINQKPKVELIDFNPSFSNAIFFIHLNKKQNSREGIKRYRSLRTEIDKRNHIIQKISQISMELTQVQSLSTFESLLCQHEEIIASAIELKEVKTRLFGDFKGAVKSLGAWGGDFILVTGNLEYVKNYFNKKGYFTIIPYDTMVLK